MIYLQNTPICLNTSDLLHLTAKADKKFSIANMLGYISAVLLYSQAPVQNLLKNPINSRGFPLSKASKSYLTFMDL